MFQRGLSSPTSVLNFLQPSNTVIQEFIERVHERRSQKTTDFLPELSRLFLECVFCFYLFSVLFEHFIVFTVTCLAALDLRLDSFSPIELLPNSRSSKLIQAALVTNSCILKTDNGLQLWRKFETPLYRKLRKAQEYMEE